MINIPKSRLNQPVLNTLHTPKGEGAQAHATQLTPEAQATAAAPELFATRPSATTTTEPENPLPAPALALACDTRDPHSAFDLALPEDRAAIQHAIGLILQRIVTNRLDPRRAGLLLYALEIASCNLPKADKKPNHLKP